MAEAVVGDRDVVAGDQHAGGHHLGGGVSGLGQVLLQRRPAVGRIAQAEVGNRLAAKPALLEIAPRFLAAPGGQLRLEELCRRGH